MISQEKGRRRESQGRVFKAQNARIPTNTLRDQSEKEKLKKKEAGVSNASAFIAVEKEGTTDYRRVCRS